MITLRASTDFVDRQIAAYGFFEENNSHLIQAHHENAVLKANDELIFRAILFAQQRDVWKKIYRGSRTHMHPSLFLLCEFWKTWSEKHEPANISIAEKIATLTPALPYLQLFWGHTDYYPLAVATPMTVIPSSEAEKISRSVSSCLMGNLFYVTFLQYAPTHGYYDTFRSCPCLRINSGFDACFSATDANHDSGNLAQQLVTALRNFPKGYPRLWDYLQARYVQR